MNMESEQPTLPKAGPSFNNKFKVLQAQEIIKEQLAESLAKHSYIPEAVSQTTRDIVEQLKARLKKVLPPNYKLIVQVLIGEQRGQGIAMGFRGFWDNDTDNYARETFSNNTVFAVGICYALYRY
ncbi:Tctex-1 family protein [Tritrichomonas foetus]|uniref:Tctex-1 family protein n=1 Tax=Tritrichomonas foetus TaxID=1144522 RepID=A0A1J4JX32_9EUKA|nr:Tctex-1 family protein [Tritrichomonas foetus]|eukprot:OHT03555.1 Tctex-1 family protein [Tritrichomonas foetus]